MLEPFQSMHALGQLDLFDRAEPFGGFGLRFGDDIGGNRNLHGLKRCFKGSKVIGEPDDRNSVGDGIDGADEIHQRTDDDRLRPIGGVTREKRIIQHQDKVNHF